MDAKSIGENIARLRKKQGLTQQQLAEKLNVSNKAVSKWENGQGYPDIHLFPTLATLFNISIDYLMRGDRKGITIAGNMLADIVKTIDSYPKCGMLSYISEISYAVGGCVPNTAINLAKIDRSVPISVAGKLGMDENGRYVLQQLQLNGIDTERVVFSQTESTSFSDAMSMPSGERTFFHMKGANAEFSPSDIDISSLNCDILHIGYILLLDQFDAPDAEYGTVMARFLHDVQAAGIKTSIDVVSNNSADYGAKIIPALKYCNYVIINEIECCYAFNLEARKKNGDINKANVRLAMQKMAEYGVKDKIIIHSKEMGFVLDVKSGQYTEMMSFEVPKEDIKGSVGAGDAFCAGSLYSLYNGFTDKQLLEFASSAAVCNLFAANSVDGMRSRNEIMKLSEKYRRLSNETYRI
ncbi:MAG: helix-turn-helix domain-containing protein [Clostridia bacterium]|nr:helix-turn-helix domain-containing protein [Clostridia bacterium]